MTHVLTLGKGRTSAIPMHRTLLRHRYLLLFLYRNGIDVYINTGSRRSRVKFSKQNARLD